jgi:hypothetical protein
VPFESLHVLADVTLAQPPPPPAPTTAKSLKPQEPINYQRRQPRSYIGKKSKVSVDAQNLATDSGIPLSEPIAAVFGNVTQRDDVTIAHSADADLCGVSVEKVTASATKSVETFFVDGKEYVVSPSNDTFVQEHTGDGDTTAGPYTRGSN